MFKGSENDLEVFYLHHQRAGNYHVTEAVERWLRLSPRQRGEIVRGLKDAEDESK